MTFKVQVGPHQISIHQGQTVLVSEPDGQIRWPSDKGLYFLDTRVISSWAIYANGEPWDMLNGGAVTHYASRVYLTNRRIPTMDGFIPQRTLGLVLSRSISGGMRYESFAIQEIWPTVSSGHRRGSTAQSARWGSADSSEGGGDKSE